MQNHGVNTLGYRCLQPSWKRFSPQFNQSEGEWACVRRLLTSPLPPSLASRWQCRACIFSCKAVSLSFGAVQFKMQCSSQKWCPGRCREGQCNLRGASLDAVHFFLSCSGQCWNNRTLLDCAALLCANRWRNNCHTCPFPSFSPLPPSSLLSSAPRQTCTQLCFTNLPSGQTILCSSAVLHLYQRP